MSYQVFFLRIRKKEQMNYKINQILLDTILHLKRKVKLIKYIERKKMFFKLFYLTQSGF